MTPDEAFGIMRQAAELVGLPKVDEALATIEAAYKDMKYRVDFLEFKGNRTALGEEA